MVGVEPAALLRDFVNTHDVEDRTDELNTPDDLRRWLARRGLMPADAPAEERDLRDALTLREGLRAAMRAHHDGGAPAPSAEVDRVLGELPVRVSLGEPALVPLGDGPRAGLARIAAAVVGCRRDGTWARLKICREDTCQWAFLDTSKNRSRSWCSMRVCGNRTKTRAYRTRHRAETG